MHLFPLPLITLNKLNKLKTSDIMEEMGDIMKDLDIGSKMGGKFNMYDVKEFKNETLSEIRKRK